MCTNINALSRNEFKVLIFVWSLESKGNLCLLLPLWPMPQTFYSELAFYASDCFLIFWVPFNEFPFLVQQHYLKISHWSNLDHLARIGGPIFTTLPSRWNKRKNLHRSELRLYLFYDNNRTTLEEQNKHFKYNYNMNYNISEVITLKWM